MIEPISTRDLRALESYFRDAPERAQRASVFAVNDAAEFGRTLSSSFIRKELNFTAGYLLEDGRLQVIKRAAGNNLEAIVRGRDRPTMLSRFASGSKKPGRPSRTPRVRVLAGKGASPVKNSFFVPLNNGNVGLAVRLRPGQRIPGKNIMANTRGGIYVLYGPSVGQAARSAFPGVVDEVSDRLQTRFVHHFERLR